MGRVVGVQAFVHLSSVAVMILDVLTCHLSRQKCLDMKFAELAGGMPPTRPLLAGPPSLLKVLAAQPSNSDALFRFTPAQATDGMAAAASGGLDGLNLITRKDRYGRSASQPSDNQVYMPKVLALIQWMLKAC